MIISFLSIFPPSGYTEEESMGLGGHDSPLPLQLASHSSCFRPLLAPCLPGTPHARAGFVGKWFLPLSPSRGLISVRPRGSFEHIRKRPSFLRGDAARRPGSPAWLARRPRLQTIQQEALGQWAACAAVRGVGWGVGGCFASSRALVPSVPVS